MSVKYDPVMKKWVVDDRFEIWEHKYLVLLSTLGYLAYANAPEIQVTLAKKNIEDHLKRKPT